jgi:excisionase family DNA binding protein
VPGVLVLRVLARSGVGCDDLVIVLDDYPVPQQIQELWDAQAKKTRKARPGKQKTIPPGAVLLDIGQAGTYLGRTAKSIEHLVAAKELPTVRIGRRVHLDRRDLDKWIEKNKV